MLLLISVCRSVVILSTSICIPVLPMVDTVKSSADGTQVDATLDRRLLFRAQTPQVFRLDIYDEAIRHARQTGFVGTDDASLLEHAKFPVAMVRGDETNIKLTTPGDLVRARWLIDNHRLQGPSLMDPIMP